VGVGDSLPTPILRRWLHSREEDTPGVRVYRPAGHAFPPSRGRPGLEFRPGGEFLRIGIGAADGTRAVRGRWEAAPGGRVRIVHDDGREEVLRIVSVDEEVLRIGGPGGELSGSADRAATD
jgi:hypothetical protein